MEMFSITDILCDSLLFYHQHLSSNGISELLIVSRKERI
jgi:hypothetical protein